MQSTTPDSAWPGTARPSVDSLLGLNAPKPSTDTFFGFRVGRFAFLVPVNVHCEVIEQTRANPLPNTQPWFSGLINLRGNLVPVFDLRLILGEEPAGSQRRRLFTIGKGDKCVAVWIDGLPEVLSMDAGKAPPLPDLPERVRPFVSDGRFHHGQVWLYLRYEEWFRELGALIAA